jgi:hypothetical protein
MFVSLTTATVPFTKPVVHWGKMFVHLAKSRGELGKSPRILAKFFGGLGVFFVSGAGSVMRDPLTAR